jgi:hypothetical protein
MVLCFGSPDILPHRLVHCDKYHSFALVVYWLKVCGVFQNCENVCIVWHLMFKKCDRKE